jgi:hypothetical protein
MFSHNSQPSWHAQGPNPYSSLRNPALRHCCILTAVHKSIKPDKFSQFIFISILFLSNFWHTMMVVNATGWHSTALGRERLGEIDQVVTLRKLGSKPRLLFASRSGCSVTFGRKTHGLLLSTERAGPPALSLPSQFSQRLKAASGISNYLTLFSFSLALS